MLKMVDGSGIIGVDMICPLGISTPQPPNYDRVELEGAGMLVLPNSLDAPLERLELSGKTEQVTTTGAQLLKPKDGSYTVFGVSVDIANGEIKLSGTATSSGGRTIRLSEPFLLKAGTYSSEVDGKIDFILSKNSDNSYLTNLLVKNFNVNEDTEVYVGLNVMAQNTYNNKYHIMLNSGNIPLPYEPYTGGKPSPSPEYPQEIKNSGKRNEETQKYEVNVKVTGKNLLNLRNPSVRFDRCILQGDGSIKSDIRSNYYFCSIYVDDPYVVDNIKNDQAITFSIGKGIQNRSITISLHGERVGSVNYQEKSSVPGGNSVSIVPSGFKKVSKIELRFNRSGSLFTDTETVVRDFMIHFGESTPYQPYKEQTLTITSDRPITKWDKLEKRNSVYGILYGSKHVVLNGSEEDWVKSSIDNTFYLKSFKGLQTSYEIFCDKLKNFKASVNEIELNCILGNRTNLYICIDGITDIGTLKTWLSENNLEVYYNSKESQFVPLPQSEQNAIRALKTYYPTTVITVDGGEVDPDIKVTYRKEK